MKQPIPEPLTMRFMPSREEVLGPDTARAFVFKGENAVKYLVGEVIRFKGPDWEVLATIEESYSCLVKRLIEPGLGHLGLESAEQVAQGMGVDLETMITFVRWTESEQE